MAPWIADQVGQLLAQQGHAWLLTGPAGLGQLDLATALVSAWLCEAPLATGACGQCTSCHAISVHTHADLCVLMPETAMLAAGWPLGDREQDDIDTKKRKPGKEIRVEAMRDTIEFAQRTRARGRGKAVLVFPAERMNVYTANALLKTLEEPPGDVRFVLASEAAHGLSPTLRSRCLRHNMVWPDPDAATQWLMAQGLSDAHAAITLRASGGKPRAALAFAPIADLWRTLPQAVLRGDVSVFKDWTPPQVVDVLHKICHDALAIKAGGQPRFFDASDVPVRGSWHGLTTWAGALANTLRTVEHPFHAGLMVEALVLQAQLALGN